MKELLRKLTETPGVSGDEHRVRESIREEVEDHAGSTEVDNMGNLIARKGSGDKTLMISAHMDQIGLSVKHIDENGYLKFSKVGGVTTQSLMNQRVTIHTQEDDVTGVIGMKPPHLMDKENMEDLPDEESLFIDIGLEDREAVEESSVRVGDYITFERDFSELGEGYVTSQAMDNRVGCVAAIECLRRFDESYELVVVFSSQEEVGLKGAKTSAFKIDPDVAVAVDVSIAGDVPGVSDSESSLETGEGPEITMVQSQGRGLITPESVRNWMRNTADEMDHDYQPGVTEGGATDAANIYLVREGVPTGSVGVPLRNMHSGTEVLKLEDLEDTVDYMADCFRTLEDHF